MLDSAILLDSMIFLELTNFLLNCTMVLLISAMTLQMTKNIVHSRFYCDIALMSDTIVKSNKKLVTKGKIVLSRFYSTR